MQKKAQFFIDDVIWLFRDLTNKRPASMFDNPFLGTLKVANELYGVKTQLNVFYKTSFWYGKEDFSLSDMTDAYKKEFEESSSWLKLAFHSMEEWPDYPYVNADYELVDRNFKLIHKEICRFAGEKSFGWSVVPHWAPISEEGIRALKDNGVKVTYATYGAKQELGDRDFGLSEEHRARLFHNKKPESGVYMKTVNDVANEAALCSYNHVSTEEYMSQVGKFGALKDEKTGMGYTVAARVVLNKVTLKELTEAITKHTDYEYFPIGNHEQYFYSDYGEYQPDYVEKILTMGKLLKDAGYTFVFAEGLVD